MMNKTGNAGTQNRQNKIRRYNDGSERANRLPNKADDYSKQAQNVNVDNVLKVNTLKDDETDPACNKATEGIKQGRDRSDT